MLPAWSTNSWLWSLDPPLTLDGDRYCYTYCNWFEFEFEFEFIG